MRNTKFQILDNYEEALHKTNMHMMKKTIHIDR